MPRRSGTSGKRWHRVPGTPSFATATAWPWRSPTITARRACSLKKRFAWRRVRLRFAPISKMSARACAKELVGSSPTEPAVLLAGSAVLWRHRQSLIGFLNGQKRRGANADQPARSCSGRERRHCYVVRRIDDENDVVGAQSEVHAFYFSLEALHGALNGRLAPGRLVFHQSLEPFCGIASLDQIFRHRIPPLSVILLMQPSESTGGLAQTQGKSYGPAGSSHHYTRRRPAVIF